MIDFENEYPRNVAPLRERELKHRDFIKPVYPMRVAPLRERELKLVITACISSKLSRSLRGA